MMRDTRGSEWRKWDLHVHTASSYDYEYKNNKKLEFDESKFILNFVKRIKKK